MIVLHANATELAKNDTTFRYRNKTIQMEDSVGKIKVKVYEMGTNNDTLAYKQLYEGIYTEGKSYEKWTVMEEVGLQIPFLSKINAKHRQRKFTMEPHWAGIGWGFANITNSAFKMNIVDGVSVKAEESNQWFFNLTEKIIPIYRNNIGITTGLGFSWSRFYLDNNTHLMEINNITNVYDAPRDIHYEYSRLRIASINIPLLLEWQPTFGTNHRFFLSAGVVGGINISASSKVKYTDVNGDTVKDEEYRGLNTAPLSLDYMAQVGYRNMSVYAKYSPFSIFQDGKGPNVRAVSLGLFMHF
jgi:hypothetical protein